MSLNSMAKGIRSMLLGAAAVIAVGTFTACSTAAKDITPASAPARSVGAMPAMATFIADMPANGASTMTTMAIAVEGDKVVAYATNGTTDEAYLFGTQKDGRMDLTSAFADHLTASYDGSKIDGELVMNEDGAAPQKFAAAPVAAPAGIYRAAYGNSRATWVVRPDRSLIGVMNNSAPGDHKLTEAIAAQDQQFKDVVRRMRLSQQMQQAPSLAVGAWTVEMGGATVTAVPVTGGMIS